MASHNDSLLEEVMQNLNEKLSESILKSSSSFQTLELWKSQKSTKDETTKQGEENMTSTFHPSRLNYDGLKVDEPKMPFESEIPHYENDSHIDPKILFEQMNKKQEERLKINLPIGDSNSKARDEETAKQRAHKITTTLHRVPVSLIICNMSNVQNVEPLTSRQSTTLATKTQVEKKIKNTFELHLGNFSRALPIEDKNTPLNSAASSCNFDECEKELTSCALNIRNYELSTDQLITHGDQNFSTITSQSLVNMQTCLPYSHFLGSEVAVSHKNVQMEPSRPKNMKLTTAERCRRYRARKKALEDQLPPSERKKRKKFNNAECCRTYRARKKALKSHQPFSEKRKTDNKLTAAERSRRYYEGKKLLMLLESQSERYCESNISNDEPLTVQMVANETQNLLPPSASLSTVNVQSSTPYTHFLCNEKTTSQIARNEAQNVSQPSTSGSRAAEIVQSFIPYTFLLCNKETTCNLNAQLLPYKNEKMELHSAERSCNYRTCEKGLSFYVPCIKNDEPLSAEITTNNAQNISQPWTSGLQAAVIVQHSIPFPHSFSSEVVACSRTEWVVRNKTKKTKQTTAESCRKYREPRKSLKGQIINNEDHNLVQLSTSGSQTPVNLQTCIPYTKFVCGDEAASHLNVKVEPNKTKKMKLTAAERCRRYRERKKVLNNYQRRRINRFTNADRCRMYRARKKALKPVKSKTQDEEPLTVQMVANEAQNLSQPSTSSSQARVNIPSSELNSHFPCNKETTCNINASLIPNKIEEMNPSSVERREKTLKIQQSANEINRKFTNAERCRRYRARKKALKYMDSNIADNEPLTVQMAVDAAQNFSQPSTSSSPARVIVQSSERYSHFLCRGETTTLCNTNAQLIPNKNEGVKLSLAELSRTKHTRNEMLKAELTSSEKKITKLSNAECCRRYRARKKALIFEQPPMK